MKKISCIIIAIIVIVGTVMCFTKGFNIELVYSNRAQISIKTNTEIDSAKIEEIAKSILVNKKVKVLRTERFNNAVQIVSSSISDEEKENLINKINEELGTEISNDDTKIVEIPNTRIRDIVKPYILAGLISYIVVILYFAIIYNKLGIAKILLNSIWVPIITELAYYSIILIARIPFGRITNAVAIGLYIISIGALTVYFQKEKLTKNNKKEND